MEDYDIIGWPEIQYLMNEEGFEENTTLITPNDSMGIGSSTYLVFRGWSRSLGIAQSREQSWKQE